MTIDRPEVRNAIGFATVAELGRRSTSRSRRSAAVLVLRGGGDRAFVSGGDLKELGAVRTHDDAVAMARTVRRLLDRLATFPVPVIAALNGHALGGGAEVAVAADIRIAADDVKIGFNQVRLGIMPAWGGAERLAQVVGRGRALLAIADRRALRRGGRARARASSTSSSPRSVRRTSGGRSRGGSPHRRPGPPAPSRRCSAPRFPTHRPELEADAADAFARLWTADAHWDAVDALEQQAESSDDVNARTAFSECGRWYRLTSESRIPRWLTSNRSTTPRSPCLAPAGGLTQPQRRAVAGRAAGAAVPRRRVRADRREGHDRVHDPRGDRPVEAVAARLLPVLRRQGRAAPRAVRGDDPRVDRGPARVDRGRDRAARRLRAFTIRLHEWCDPARRRKRGTHNRRPISEFSVQLAVTHPDACRAAMAPQVR